MADSPPDKIADIDVTSLSQHAASEYRQELINVIFYQPGIELDAAGPDLEGQMTLYKRKLREVDAYLSTFPEKI